jgi:hypothetical protein
MALKCVVQPNHNLRIILDRLVVMPAGSVDGNKNEGILKAAVDAINNRV